jgi:hypothetical protein
MNITEYYNHVVNKIASVTATVERSGATPVQTNPYESVNKSNSSQGTSKGDGIVQRVLDSADKALNSILKRWTSGKVGTDDAGARLLMMEEEENHIFMHVKIAGSIILVTMTFMILLLYRHKYG